MARYGGRAGGVFNFSVQRILESKERARARTRRHARARVSADVAWVGIHAHHRVRDERERFTLAIHVVCRGFRGGNVARRKRVYRRVRVIVPRVRLDHAFDDGEWTRGEPVRVARVRCRR